MVANSRFVHLLIVQECTVGVQNKSRICFLMSSESKSVDSRFTVFQSRYAQFLRI